MIRIKMLKNEVVEEHFKSFKDYLSQGRTKYSYGELNDWFVNKTNEKYSFEDIIKLRPEKFLEVSQILENIKSAPEIEYLKTLYSYYANNSHDYFSNKFNAFSLINKLNLIVCPFCNRNYITTTKITKRQGQLVDRRSADLDHFFNKSNYPYFSISIYNLIPCCKVCNYLKGTENIGVNPYTISNHKSNFQFCFTFEESLNNYKIQFKNISPEYESNYKVLGLEHHYLNHKNYLEELLFRLSVYNEDYIEDLIKRKYFDEQDFDKLKSLLIGNLVSEDEFHTSPLSKLTKDIFDTYY